jgi:acetylglutamate kinase
VGLSGVDGGLIQALPHEDPELGMVGQAGVVQAGLLATLMAGGMVPVIAPLALDGRGQLRNLNADTACGAVASALRADLAIFLTDVPGVLDAQGTLLPRLSRAAVEALIADGTIHGGMVPKVGACLTALQRGAQAVCIADGRVSGALLAISEGRSGQGTIIRQEPWA